MVTEKAARILDKIRRRAGKEPWMVLRSHEARDQSTLDDVGPARGAEQGIKVLQEMIELGGAQEQFIREDIPNNTVD